ncbi:MAG: endolytic transglycosylase MltG [Pseudohongiella sp.]|nr:endolytic transglycosylase MltG [Pseudohongiella sp.]
MLNTAVSFVRKYWVRTLLILLMSVALGGALVFYSVKQYLETPIFLNEPRVVAIEPGSSLTQITRRLENDGILNWPRVLVLWARWQGIDRLVRTGEYELTPGLTPVSLMSLLMSGRNVQYPVTLVEGWTVRQSLEHLWAQESVLVTLSDKTDEEIMAILQSPFPALEGNLFPDTYFFTRNTTDEAILKRAHSRLLEVLEAEWQVREPELPYDSPWQALIMASIIEKESGYQAEKADIAGVFVRRLQQGMRLQSDPTIIYGMGSAYSGVIRRSDIDTTTPWNTYRIDGLPPTPIAISGRDSIRASLNPNPGTALYFVSRGDGSHQFSDTLQEHNAAVRRYLRNNNE